MFSLKKNNVISGHPSLSLVVFSDLLTSILICGEDTNEVTFEKFIALFPPPACPTNPTFKNKARLSIGLFGSLKLAGMLSDMSKPNQMLDPCSANLSLICSTEAKPEATPEL